MELEVVKMVCVVVTQQRDDNGKVIAEAQGAPQNCFTVEEVAKVWQEAEEEIANLNAQQNGNRAQRRSKQKPPKVEVT